MKPDSSTYSLLVITFVVSAYGYYFCYNIDIDAFAFIKQVIILNCTNCLGLALFRWYFAIKISSISMIYQFVLILGVPMLEEVLFNYLLPLHLQVLGIPKQIADYIIIGLFSLVHATNYYFVTRSSKVLICGVVNQMIMMVVLRNILIKVDSLAFSMYLHIVFNLCAFLIIVLVNKFYHIDKESTIESNAQNVEYDKECGNVKHTKSYFAHLPKRRQSFPICKMFNQDPKDIFTKVVIKCRDDIYDSMTRQLNQVDLSRF